jgi:hypothetical protein
MDGNEIRYHALCGVGSKGRLRTTLRLPCGLPSDFVRADLGVNVSAKKCKNGMNHELVDGRISIRIWNSRIFLTTKSH